MQELKNSIFINRELSWIDFNRRVLELVKEPCVPIGERLRFLSIYASNLDEFFMVRIGSLYDRTLLKKSARDNKTGWTPVQQLEAAMPRVREMQHACDKWTQRLWDELHEIGCCKVDFEHLGKKQEHFWKQYFTQEVLPLLSPQVVDRRHPFPFLRSGETYLGAMLKQKGCEEWALGLVPVSGQMKRIVFVQEKGAMAFALTEELILHFAPYIFGKKAVQGKCLFRVTRNADITMDEAMFDHEVDYRDIMRELLKKRRRQAAVRLQASAKAPAELVAYLQARLMLGHSHCFEQSAPLDLSVGFQIASRLAQEGQPAWFYPPRRPMQPPAGFDLQKAVQHGDVLLAYPYQSIRPFLSLLQKAAHDPEVVSIKMTLYRVAQESKIIEALINAAENGKEVVAVVELRARFDEQNNIDYSKRLEEAGCTVIYGFDSYKVHSKLTLITKVVRGERVYLSQIGTGNYNERTSEQYTDLSYLTMDCDIGEELAGVFHNLALGRLTPRCERLLVAPLCFKNEMLEEIDREIEASRMGKPAQMILKCNSVSDKEIIEKLSEASCAGVKIQMIVRGICCLKAGVPGKTENITVRSIIGRYLEHERVYCFGAGERARIYMASGDYLTRNTERRVEVGVRIQDRRLMRELEQLLQMQLEDQANAYEMRPDGSYHRVKCKAEHEPADSQLGMYDLLKDAWPVQGCIQEHTPVRRVRVRAVRRCAPRRH